MVFAGSCSDTTVDTRTSDTSAAVQTTTTDASASTTSTTAANEPATRPAPNDECLSDHRHGCGLPGDFFGVEPLSLGLNAGQIPVVFDVLDDLGVGTAGVNAATWGDLEPEPPVGGVHTYDWETLDRIAREADDHGISLQITLQASSPWGTESTGGSIGSPGSSPVKPEHLDDFDAWVTALVLRYAGDAGQRLDGLSQPVLSRLMLGNEIEVPGHWAANGTPTNPATAAAYHDLLDRFADLVNAAAPDVTVMRAATNYGSSFDDDPTVDEITERVTARGGPPGASFADFQTEAFDPNRRYEAFGVHPNHGAATLFHLGAWLDAALNDDVTIIAEDMRSTLVDSGFSERWADRDESGIDDVHEMIRDGAEDQGLDGAPDEIVEFRRMQAATLAQKTILAAHAGYEAVYASSLFDFGADYALPEWWFAGLVNGRAREARPAFHAYAELIDLLEGATPTSIEYRPDGVSVARFDTGEGTTITMAWAATATDVDVTDWGIAGASVARLPALPGEDTAVAVPANADGTITVGEVPVFTIT